MGAPTIIKKNYYQEYITNQTTTSYNYQLIYPPKYIPDETSTSSSSTSTSTSTTSTNTTTSNEEPEKNISSFSVVGISIVSLTTSSILLSRRKIKLKTA